METSLPTPTTARVQLLIYQRVATTTFAPTPLWRERQPLMLQRQRPNRPPTPRVSQPEDVGVWHIKKNVGHINSNAFIKQAIWHHKQDSMLFCNREIMKFTTSSQVASMWLNDAECISAGYLFLKFPCNTKKIKLNVQTCCTLLTIHSLTFPSWWSRWAAKEKL